AEKKGIASGFFLFNKFQGENNYDEDPFIKRQNKSNESKNTQLILIRSDSPTLSKPIYFFMYDAISKDGKLKTFLTATFDARAKEVVTENKYFVPASCAQCHGGIIKPDGINPVPEYEKLKLNYLDTDHWIDRTNDDFAFLKNYPHAVLYDGGKDETSDKFNKAFDVIRRLNREIMAQNEKVEATPDRPAFQLRAVRKWFELHETNSLHQDIFSRALTPIVAGNKQWNNADPIDKELLPLMNQYCVRCHSSVLYNVFDRPEVLRRKSRIALYVNIDDVNSKFRMPQDRVLDDAVKQRIIQLVRQLQP
ncbi:MAG: hypothetical protein ABIP06_10500, partial [Pyrinomonadaceae bacterium]